MSIEEHIANLNQRFIEGRPSNNNAEAGVLVRVFDRLDAGDDGKPYLPCPQKVKRILESEPSS